MTKISAEYDPGIIQEFANGLYSQAERALFVYTFWGFVLGVLLGFSVFILDQSGDAYCVSAIFVLIGSVVGHLHGKRVAFEVKLKAQLALCQLQIERNTNPNIS